MSKLKLRDFPQVIQRIVRGFRANKLIKIFNMPEHGRERGLFPKISMKVALSGKIELKGELFRVFNR